MQRIKREGKEMIEENSGREGQREDRAAGKQRKMWDQQRRRGGIVLGGEKD